MKSFLLSFLLTGLVFLLGAQDSLQNEATRKLHEIFELEQKYGEQEDNPPFPKVLPASQKERADFWQDLLDQLEEVPSNALTKTDRINLAVFKYILQDRIAQYEYQAYLIPFNAEGGFYNALNAGRGGRFRSAEDYQKFHDRLRDFPRYMRENMQLMRLGIEKGVTAPRLIADNYRVLIGPYLQTPVEEHILYTPYLEMPENIGPAAADSIRRTGRQLIRDSILYIYRRFDEFMQEDYLPAAREEAGIYGIPQGKDYYEQRVAYFTSLDVTPEEVFQTGQREVARIRQAMESIIREVGFEGDFAAFLHFLRTDPQFYLTKPQALLEKASYWSKKIDGRLPAYFGTLPRLPYGVAPVPDAIAPNYTGGRYVPGSSRRHRAGTYWVNTYKLDSRPLYVLPALTLHEAVPGHHL
ncbi:MAG: DUF885 domain-containing protein, partial [Saprospiraceae bacterium]|nr:DUF885 domain-containing protein [Saprospiraceae bacterium]